MHELGLCIRVDIYVAHMLYECSLSNNTSVPIYVVPKEKIRTVNPLQGKLEFLANKTIKVNPNGGKQGGIPEKESTGIANPKSNPNGLQKKLVPRRPRENSNKDPSGSNSNVPAKAKRNPQRESTLSFTPKYDPSGHQKEINS